MSVYDVLVGFSVNPEFSWTTGASTIADDKKVAAVADIQLFGTSFDVAYAMRQAGLKPFLVGTIGQSDTLNLWLCELLRQANLPNLLLAIRQRTAIAHVEPKSGRHLSFKPPLVDLPAGDIRQKLATITPAIRVVTGLMPDLRELQLARLLLDGRHCLRVINPRAALVADRRRFCTLLKGVDWLFLSQPEANAFSSNHTPVDAADFIGCGPKLVVVTKDRQGATLVTVEGGRWEVPAYCPGTPVHETGAGDCFLGYFIAGYLRQRSLAECLALAAVAAGIKVTVPGTASSPPYHQVLLHLERWEYYRNLRSSVVASAVSL